MNSRQIRRENRIPASTLSSHYKNFKVVTSKKNNLTAMTVDASRSGIGFYADAYSTDFTIGSKIELHLEGQKKPVFGKVVYAKAIGGLTRVGTELEKEEGYAEYKKGIVDEEKKVLS